MAKKDRPQLPDGPKERHITTYGPPVLAWDRSWSFNEYVDRLQGPLAFPHWFKPYTSEGLLHKLGRFWSPPWRLYRRYLKRRYNSSYREKRRLLRVYANVKYALSASRWAGLPARRIRLIVRLLRALPSAQRERLFRVWAISTEWLMWQHVSIREGKRKKTSRQVRIVRRSSRH